MATVSTIDVIDIYLDQKNPRHGILKDQSVIIKQLIKSENVKPLAKDISLNGVSPIESLGVVKDKGNSYTAVEGNRRLCALLLLNDPERAPENHKNYFRKLSKNNKKIPSKVNCVVFKDRKEADIWIERRHEGELDGIGTRQWRPEQKNRFNERLMRHDSNALANSVLDYAITQGFLSEDEKSKNLTTATRFLSNPFFRKTIGLTSTSAAKKEILLNVPKEEFDLALQQFCLDLVKSKSKVSSRTTAPQREEYAKELIENGKTPKIHVDQYDLNDTESNNPSNSEEQDKDDAAETGSTDTERENNDPSKRKYIIESGFVLKIKNSNLRRIYIELKAMEVDNYPYAVSCLVRGFLENLYRSYLDTFSASSNLKTGQVLDKIVDQIQLDGS